MILAIGGAVAFGLLLGYLAWINDSFPAQERPFSSFARVGSSTFNGTEYAFRVQWLSPDFIPLYAQLTSPSSDSANTIVCDVNSTSVGRNETLFMPFSLSSPSTSLTNVDLSIAVQSRVNGTEFTINYNVGSVAAVQGDIEPQDLSCQEPSAPM
ncbi:MAG TPA: hypothetical protein VKF15_07130 [Nitrososphaerales archaeon]|nr:hypothetical protein [Nitrososphaerales archaeon]